MVMTAIVMMAVLLDRTDDRKATRVSDVVSVCYTHLQVPTKQT